MLWFRMAKSQTEYGSQILRISGYLCSRSTPGNYRGHNSFKSHFAISYRNKHPYNTASHFTSWHLLNDIENMLISENKENNRKQRKQHEMSLLNVKTWEQWIVDTK